MHECVYACVCVRQLTQDGHHHVVLEDLDGTPRNKVKGGENVAAVDQGVPGGGVGGSEAHGQRAQAAFVGPPEGLAVLQQAAVQVQANVSLQTFGEALQNLQKESARRG